jgi:hypothetical protein
VTSDSAVKASPPASDTIPSPAGGILIELKSDDVVRYATSGRDGRFVFDGLADDSYKLTGYATEYPNPSISWPARTNSKSNPKPALVT